MSNTLNAFIRLCDLVIEDFVQDYNVPNRVTQVGNALENFVKNLYANSFGLEEDIAKTKRKSCFSYCGNAKNPPDLILKAGDAIEIKKLEGIPSYLPLNSSHPKDYLYVNDGRISGDCRSCEESPWVKKDMVYVIGSVDKKDTKKLKGLWFVYGNCYAADKEVYEKSFNSVKSVLDSSEDVNSSETRELGRLNNVDPLEATYLRVRGMWHIKHPQQVFNSLNLDINSDFFAHVIVTKEKFDSFPLEDRNLLDEILSKNTNVQKREVKIDNPNNPAKDLTAIILSLSK
ncbi:NgoPII family restriction endonuclease [Acinetobacter baumannii]|uniref:NgoPII family restriction endonuclease n=1 Tax=Acinetobacter baumannii TaxID=470 RepID=UPI0038912A2A